MTIAILDKTETTVTISRADWDAMIGQLEDRADSEAARRSESAPPRTRFTADETRRIVLEGESPLRVLRRRAGMTQTGIARSAGLGTSYVSEIESGKKPGSLDALRRLADVLGADVADLLL